MPALRELLNLGPASEAMLHTAGITGVEQLEELGSIEAYLRVREVRPDASRNSLYALEGALLDVRWDLLPKDLRARLAQAADEAAAGGR